MSVDRLTGAEAAAWQACLRRATGRADPAFQPAPPDAAALADPVTLAAHLDSRFQVRVHLRVIGQVWSAIRSGDVDRATIDTPPQIGKPVYAGTMVLMADGSRKRIDEIVVGDQVITHKGRPRTVHAVHRQGELPTVRIVAHSGRSTVAALDHPFLTPEGWVKAADLRPGMSLALVPQPDCDGAGPLSAEEARLLGMIVGDGSVSETRQATDTAVSQFNTRVTCVDSGVSDELHRCAEAAGFTIREVVSPYRARQYGLSGGVRPWLRSHGLAGTTSHTKRVPAAVFRARPDVIAEFIGGYWDCDGVVSSRGKDRNGLPRPDVHCELYSVSFDLLDDVQHLLLRLGIRSTIRVKMGSYNDAAHVSYRLQLIARDDVARFRSMIRLHHGKRAAALVAHPLHRTSFDGPLLADPIVSVDGAGLNECLCLTVADDSTFTADDFVVHNTTAAVEWAAFWWLAQHPADRIIVGSYGDTLAVKRGRNIRRLVIEHGARFGLALDPLTHAAHDWSLTTGGGVRSVGVGAGITGEPGSVVILDDPTKSRAEAESLAHRDRVGEWYSADILSRLAPRAPLMIIQTRWHDDDLIGRVLRDGGKVEDGGRWRAVHMPALCTDPARDPLGRHLGEPLPHPKIPEGDTAALLRHWEDRRRSSTVRDWAALYQGDPRPVEGALVQADLLRERRCYQHGSPSAPCAQPQLIAVAVDPSGGGRDAAGIVGGYLGEDDRLYLTHDRSGVMPSDQWARTVCELAAEIDADKIFCEVNYGGDQATLVIRTAWEALRRGNPARFGALIPRIVAVRARRGKLLRAEPIAQQWVEDRIRTAAYLPELEQEWISWQPGPESPGRIDASVHLAYGLLPVPQSGASSAMGADLLADARLLPWST